MSHHQNTAEHREARRLDALARLQILDTPSEQAFDDLTELAARWLDTLLFEVSPGDPVTWIAVIATVGITTAVATWIPARWATAVDPRQVLSAE